MEEKPVVDALTGAKSLPMKEKLKLLDQEIRRLHRACTEAGYKPEKIREVAEPVLKTARKGDRKKTVRTLIYGLLALSIFGGLCYWEPSCFAMRVAYKKFMVYWVLPYYDWTWPFEDECILLNPYYDPPSSELTNESCTICEQMKTFPLKTNVEVDEMVEMIYALKPVIVTDAMSDWRAIKENATLDTFVRLYATDERTMNLSGTKQTNYFRTTKDLPKEIRNVTSLAKWLHAEHNEGRKPDFTAQWCNIDISSYKALHYYYTKPYFLPGMCEPIRYLSYMMIARRQTEDKGKGLIMRPRVSDMGIWIAQVSGRFEFILQPVKVCEKICEKVRFVLDRGQMLNVPTGLYQITYRPNSTEAVAIGVGYEFQ